MGVAVSTVVLQNRLNFYLDEYISGFDHTEVRITLFLLRDLVTESMRLQIKHKILDSVRSISDLGGIHQEEGEVQPSNPDSVMR